jgi:glycolate oxidase
MHPTDHDDQEHTMTSTFSRTEPGASAAALAELLSTIDDWSVDGDELLRVRSDRSGWLVEGLPEVVIRVTSADEVSRVLAFATLHRIPVVTRGAGTGLSGGASAGEGSIVLDVSSLNRIHQIDPENQIAIVGPGVITADLDRAAAAHGLRYAPDPASAAISSIGGNIATNAGGLRGAKYGVTRDAVLALTVVLADGRILRTGRQTIKGVTGYDLTSLIVGSEGTLGVVVEATVRLQPVPVETQTVVAFFDTVVDAAAAATAIGLARLQPSLLELMDGPTLHAVDDAQGTDYHRRGTAFLVAQTDGFGASAEIERITAVLRRGAREVTRALDPIEAEELVRARRLALPSIETRGRVLIEDVVVPRTRLAEAFLGIQQIAQESGVQVFVIAHAADGNLHPIILLAAEEPSEREWHVAGLIFELALRLGGTLTGEHGVGLLKQRWVRGELGETGSAVHAGIKSLFDPAGILNPGKSF